MNTSLSKVIDGESIGIGIPEIVAHSKKQRILMDLNSEAEDAWLKKDYERLLQLLEMDSPFPVGFRIEEVVAEQSIREQLQRFVEGRESLHGFIRDGDLDSVREFIRNPKSSVYYSTDNVSALSRAIECDKREICSYLSSIRSNFRIPEMVIEESNWSQDPEKSHILKFVHATRFSENQDREEWHAIINMYLELDKFDEIRWLMKTIEHENFELTFAIKSENVTTDVFGIPVNVFGYTEKNGRILIAGKGITTADSYKNVYRVFAHELCHLAMQFMYRNSFNPYHPHDEERKSDFSKICNEIQKDHEAMDKLIQKVYWYRESEWKLELIVRVPEVLAVYGKVKANQIFSEQIPKVYEYYKEHISKDSAEFSNRKFYCPKLLNLGKISDDHLAVRRSEMCTSPFVRTENYEDYLIPIKEGSHNFSLLPTSNPKLAALHVFHAFKGICPLHADRRVLAFHLEYYHVEGNNNVICDAFDESFLQKLILVMSDSKDERGKIFDDIFFCSNEEKEVIVVVSEALWKRHPEWNVEKQLEYDWNGLSADYRYRLFEKQIVYQGEKISPWTVLKDVEIPTVFTPAVLWYFMSKTDVRIGEGFSSDWNERELYVERMFVRFEYKKENFRNEKSPLHYLFVTGVTEKDLQTITTMKGGLQTIESADEIQEENYIFLPKLGNDHANLFRKLFCKSKEKQNSISWVNYEDEKFLLRDSLGGRDDIKDYFVEDTLNENQILKKSQRMNVILVADEPGTGKSTSITSLIEKMKRVYPEKFIFRLNFSEHLKDFSASPTLPSLIEFLQRVFKMNTPLEEMTFQAIIDVPRRVVVFLDGFDEMSKNIQSKVMESLKLLRKETKIQIWIFTRKHERLTLEEEMNTVSFSLRQFSFDDQRMYLNKFWLRRLISLNIKRKDSDENFKGILKNLEHYSGKCERLSKDMKELFNIRKENPEEFIKRINELDFSDYSILVINSVKDSILKGKFIVPLWLWMMANIIIGSNFKIPEQRDRYTFYRDFMEEKVDYHLRNKLNLSSELNYQEENYHSTKKKIFKSLRKFSVKVMRSEHYEKISDLKKLVDVGLLRKVGEEYHFFHITFAEFLFSQMFVEEIESVNAELLSDILIEDSYQEVRIFLDDFLEKDESQSLVDDSIEKKKPFDFPKNLIQEFKLFQIYIEFCKKRYFRYERISDRTGYWIWKRMFESCENQMKESVDENSISYLLNSSPFNESRLNFVGVLDLLNSTFTDTMLFIMVDESKELLFRCLYGINSDDLNAMISIFTKIINYKESSQNSGTGIGKLNELLTIKNGKGKNMLHVLMEYSRDPNVVTAFLEYVEGVMEGESFKDLLTQKDNKGRISISYLKLEIMKEVLEFMGRYFTNQEIGNMLMVNKVHLQESILRTRGGLLYLEEYLGSELFPEILFYINENGWTRLHDMMFNGSLDEERFVSDLKVYKRFLNSIEMKAFLLSRNKYGWTFLHLWARSIRLNRKIDIFPDLSSILSSDAFEDLLNKRDEDGKTFIHEYRPLSKLPSSLEELLGTEKFIKLVTAKDNNGYTRLYYRFHDCNLYALLHDDLEFYYKLISDKSLFREFLLSKDKKGRTFYFYVIEELKLKNQIETVNKLEDFLSSILSPELLSELKQTVEPDSEPKPNVKCEIC